MHRLRLRRLIQRVIGWRRWSFGMPEADEGCQKSNAECGPSNIINPGLMSDLSNGSSIHCLAFFSVGKARV